MSITQIASEAASYIIRPQSARATIMATMHVSQVINRSMMASARLAVSQELTLVAMAIVKPKPLELTMNAASLIADHDVASMDAAGLIVAIADMALAASCYVIKSGSGNLGARGIISVKLTESLSAQSITSMMSLKAVSAASLLLGRGIDTMEAETRIRQQASVMAAAGAFLTASVAMSLRPRLTIITDGIVSALAESAVSADSEITSAAAAALSAEISGSLLAACSICIVTDQSLTAASIMTQTAQTAIAAGMMVGLGTIAQYISAHALLVEILHTFGILQAQSIVITQASVAAHAAAAVAFNSGATTVEAGARVHKPFSPTLTANAFIVGVGQETIFAGARVGTRNRGTSDRTLYVEDYASSVIQYPEE